VEKEFLRGWGVDTITASFSPLLFLVLAQRDLELSMELRSHDRKLFAQQQIYTKL